MESDRSIPNPSLKVFDSNKRYDVKEIGFESKPGWMAVGNGRSNYKLDKGIEYMDFVKEICNMTPQELYMIDVMNDTLVQGVYKTKDDKIAKYTTNEAMILSRNYTAPQKRKLMKGYERLYAKDIVRRVKRQHYMFNPRFVIPMFYEDTVKIWDSLVKPTSMEPE